MNIQEILIAAGAIEHADIRPDGTAHMAGPDGRRMVFGPAETDDGTVEGWDVVEYFPRDDPQDGEYEDYSYVCDDEGMVVNARRYAPEA